LTPQLIADLDDTSLDDHLWLRLLDVYQPLDPDALMRAPDGVRAYICTRLFEWEVGNGGLHQYFFNQPDPRLLKLILDGYSFLGLDDARRIVEEVVAPVAAEEAAWRESLRDGTIETFFASYVESKLPEYDVRIVEHDEDRIRYVRANPELFSI